MGKWLLIIIVLFLLTGSALLSAGEFTPVYNPQLTVTRLSGTINIDGDLDDSGWQSAAVADNFAEHNPGDQTKPPVETIALITYDADNIYVAFKCFDNPNTIRASHSEREKFLGIDDNVGFFLETSGNGLWAYTLNCNPYGIQADALWSMNQGEDDSYDMIWESAGRLTDFGYQIEMAIPFSSLRFPYKEEQSWRIDFYRHRPREVYGEYSWSAYDRNESCFPCKWGTVSGFREVHSGKGLEILPSVLAYQSGSRINPDEFENDDPDGEISLGARYAIASNITAEIALNPDFSQVESDAAQIDVNTTTALYYDEKRPFFQEGSDLFRSFYTVMYSRLINDPIYAAKVIGRMGKTNIAYLSALDEHSPIIIPFEQSSAILQNGKSYSNVFSFKHSLGQASLVNALFSSRFMEGGGSGTLLSVMGEVHATQTIYFQWQAIGTYTDEPDDTTITSGINHITFDNGRHTAAFDGESYFGHGFLGAAGYYSRKYGIDLTYFEISPEFRADLGFEPTNDMRAVHLLLRKTYDLDQSILRQIQVDLQPGKEWNFDGKAREEWVRANIETSFRIAQLNTHGQYMRGRENFGGVQFDDIWNLHYCFNTRPNKFLAFSGSFNYGHTIARRYLQMSKTLLTSAAVEIHPFDRLRFETEVQFTRADDLNTDAELYNGYTVWSRFNYQFSRAFSARLLVQYDDFSKCWELDPMLTYRINSFSVFYFGSTNDILEYKNPIDDNSRWKLSGRQFFMKLQYLFQV